MTAARQARRRALRRRRAGLSAPAQRAATSQIINGLLRHPAFRRARRIGLYCAAGSEPNLWPLIHIALRRGKRVYLPRVRGTVMDFVRYQHGDALVRGAFGLQQPSRRRPRIGVRHLDLVIAPLIGFDSDGNRLGQGGGYYDRALACLRFGQWRKPVFIGAAFRLQRVDTLAPAHWDVALDAVIHDTITFPP